MSFFVIGVLYGFKISYNKGMDNDTALNALNDQDLLEMAMVIFNINEALDKKSDLKNQTKPKNQIELKADYRNHDNPYWVALWPHLTRIDGMTGDEISGRDTILHWGEERLLKKFSNLGILSFNTKTKRVEDIYETGRAGDMPESYTININPDKFAEFSEQVFRAAKSIMKKHAQLGFVNFSTPSVTVESQEYKLKTMRNGNAFDIVMYCYEKHPGNTVTLKDLKNELSLSGVTNINGALRKSHFDTSNGLLRSFVETSPQFIKVHRSIQLPILQFEDIVIASKNP